MKWNDKMGSRGRQRKLLVGVGDDLYEFAGKTIPGVVAVAREAYTKNGKWSFTDYDLVFAAGAWHFEASQSWEEGRYFDDCESVGGAAAKLTAAGCGAEVPEVVEFLRDKFPKTCVRLDEIAAGLESVGTPTTATSAVVSPSDKLLQHMQLLFQTEGLDAVRAVITRFDGSLVS